MSLDWRTLPSLTALRAFDATARHGGFAGAARSLNVTHAAVSQQVRALERELGIGLAVRDGRTVRLTQAGADLARTLATAFDTISDGVGALQARRARQGLRVTATPFLVDRIIMPHLSEFWGLHPGAEISLHPTRDYVDIEREGFDLAIRAIPSESKRSWPSLDIEPVAEMRVLAIAAPEVLRDPSVDPQSLPWLGHEGMETKLEMMRQCGLDVDRLTYVPIGSPNLLLEAVRQGMGVTIFSEQFTRADLAAGRLVEVPLPKKLHARYLAATPKGPRHPLAGPFVDWVRSLFDRDG